MTSIKFTKLYKILSDFVKNNCEERDESHGHLHMNTVANTSVFIVDNEFRDHPRYSDILNDSLIVDWLYDVSDHKYDKDGTLDERLDEFGYSNFSNFPEIKKTIKLISYSLEQKALVTWTPINYEDELGEHYALIRQIVSDADKLEAIGRIGVEQCLEYTKHCNPNFLEEQLWDAVIFHVNEKLLRLKDEFIRTNIGKMLEIPLHLEMLRELNI